jgi:phosphatidylglycerophosphate synthase
MRATENVMLKINDTITRHFERPALRWLCRNLPQWVSSNMLTGLGVAGAALSFLGYVLSAQNAGFLLLAIGGLVVNWLGDSLDGSLARYRAQERPKFGFFLDHMTDTLSIGLIALGMGLSPYAHLTSALAVLIAYYLMVILSMVTCLVTEVFQISFSGAGPTEIRLVIILFTGVAAMHQPPANLPWGGLGLTVYDVIMLSVTAVLIVACAVQAAITARQLARVDPPRNRVG